MRVAIASGKGGTGKTTVSANLAKVLSLHRPVQYVDCDVEEPNGHLFLQPKIEESIPVGIRVPKIVPELCTHCGACSALCQFHALASLKDKTLVFPELCHGCGGCKLVCPAGAIIEVERPIGVVERGRIGKISFLQGRLNVGEAMSPPLIRALDFYQEPSTLQILDAPPGTSCPVITSVRNADLVLLVTEPTPFGLHDLTLAVEMVRSLSLKMGVIINRDGIGDDRVERYCKEQGIEIWAKIPHHRVVAEAYSRGILAVDAMPEMRRVFEAIAQRLEEKQ